MPTRILIADDHSLFRAGLTALLNAEPDLEVVGEAGTGEEALRLATELHPDLVLMDLNMPELDGIEATRWLAQLLPDLRMLILTMHEDNGLMREAIHAGASGYLLKRAIKSEMIDAIHCVLRGDLYVYPAMMRALFDKPQPVSTTIKTKVEALTSREVEVLRLIVQGYTNNQIADLLSISTRTVEYHRANLMGKLNLHSRVELVRYAADHGITGS
jgi:two-component system response regulator NreC